MKPENWDTMSDGEKHKMAADLAGGVRGRYIIAQALGIASKILKKADHPWQEISNAEDMEIIGTLFTPFFEMELQNDKRPL